MQQAQGEFLRSQAGRGDLREGVEGAARQLTLQAHLVEGMDDEIAAQPVLLAHLQSVGFAVLNGFERRFLADDARAEHRVLVDLHHRLDDLRRPAGVADAEAGHGIGLGKTVQKNRALQHPGQGGDADVLPLEGEFGIDLVSDHQQIVAPHDGGDLLQVGVGHGAAGRVGREIQHQRLAPGSDDLLDVLRANREAVFRLAGHSYGHAVRHGDAGRVTDVARFVINDLIARIDQRAERDIHGLAHADGDEDLVGWVVRQPEPPLQADGNGLAQFEQTEVGGVTGPALFQGKDGGFADVPRGDEIGFAHAKGDDILHALHEFEKIANARARDIADIAGDGSVGLERLGHAWCRLGKSRRT